MFNKTFERIFLFFIMENNVISWVLVLNREKEEEKKNVVLVFQHTKERKENPSALMVYEKKSTQ